MKGFGASLKSLGGRNMAANADQIEFLIAKGYLKPGDLDNPQLVSQANEAAVRNGDLSSAVGAAEEGLAKSQDLSQVPDVDQFKLERYDPPRGRPKTLDPLITPEAGRRLTEYAKAGMDRGGPEWYNTDPLLRAFTEALGPEEGAARYRRYLEMVAATSPRAKVDNNIRRASELYRRDMAGEGLVGADLGKGYGHLAQKTHDKLLADLEGGGSFAALNRPKTSSFVENLAGNQAPMTLDTHNMAAVTGNAKNKVSPSSTQYKYLEDWQSELADKVGLTPAQWQASVWVGADDITGVADSRPWLEVFDDVLERTAKRDDTSKAEALRNFIKGDQNLWQFAGAVGIGGALAGGSEESEAAVVPGIRQGILNTLDAGSEAAQGRATMLGAEGRTFMDPGTETVARIYDDLRAQKQSTGVAVFDEVDVGEAPGVTSRGATPVARYRLPEEYAGDVAQVSRSSPDLIEIQPDEAGAQAFSEAITSAKGANKYGASVYVYPTEEYAGMRLFLTEDGTAGYALKPDGDVVSAFSTGAHRGVANNLLLHSIEQGGQKLDAFDTVLPDLYSTMGFREQGRIKWDPDEAPPDWDAETFAAFNEGEPDVSFMAYDEAPAVPVEERMVDSYGEAVEAQDRALGRVAPAAAVGAGLLGMTESEDAEAVIAGRMARRAGVPEELGTDEMMEGIAIKMEAEGRSPEEIYDTTGWYRGDEGLWKWEISDREAQVMKLPAVAKYETDYQEVLRQEYADSVRKLDDFLASEGVEQPTDLSPEAKARYDVMEAKANDNRELLHEYSVDLAAREPDEPLSNILQHDALYEAYPDLKSVPVFLRRPENMEGAQASYRPPGGLAGREAINLKRNASPESFRGSLLHEIQHAVQQREGFARGSNPDHIKRKSGADLTDKEAFDQYMDVSGEVEARMVTMRSEPEPLVAGVRISRGRPMEQMEAMTQGGQRRAPSGSMAELQEARRESIAEEREILDYEGRQAERRLSDRVKAGAAGTAAALGTAEAGAREQVQERLDAGDMEGARHASEMAAYAQLGDGLLALLSGMAQEVKAVGGGLLASLTPGGATGAQYREGVYSEGGMYSPGTEGAQAGAAAAMEAASEMLEQLPLEAMGQFYNDQVRPSAVNAFGETAVDVAESAGLLGLTIGAPGVARGRRLTQ